MTNRNKCRGLTLIEVLIALAIVGIALTAIIKATSQNIRGTTYLQTKSVALWVGQQVINEARVGVITLPPAPDKLDQSTTMLGRDWFWQASEENTPNRRVKKVTVNVYDRPEQDDIAPVVTLESYVYHDEKN